MHGKNSKHRDAPEFEENLIEYEALRNSILQCESSIKNETIYMYVTYFALIAFGFEHSWMFLVSFVVLIIFQNQINGDRLAIEKISTYIRIFFENQRTDIHWETLNKDLKGMNSYSNYIRNLGWYIDKAGSSFLAAISLVVLIVKLLQSNKQQITALSTIQLILGFVLFIIVVYINSKFYLANKTSLIFNIEKEFSDFKKRQSSKED